MEKSLRQSAETKLEIAQRQNKLNQEEIQSLKAQTLKINFAQINAQSNADKYTTAVKELAELRQENAVLKDQLKKTQEELSQT